jgi:CheY-like chemotaxis protein
MSMAARGGMLRGEDVTDGGHMAIGRVLVVDDDVAIGQVLAELLEQEGHAVVCCGSGEDALAAARAAVPDLVLLDVRMPGAGGLDGLRVADALALDPRTRAVPVVLMTAASSQERGPWGEALAGHAERVLFKPFVLGELLVTVAALLAGRCAPSVDAVC